MMQGAGETGKSSATGWVLAIVRALRSYGIDADAVLLEIGMDASQLRGGYSRYSQEQLSQLWLQAISLSGDQSFGLRVAREIRSSTFHVVGYAMSCSATVGRALHRFTRYCRLISDSATASLTESGETATLDFLFDTGGIPLIYQTIDSVVAGTLSFVRHIAGEHIVPVEVRFRHAEPDNDDAFREHFGAPITYNSAQDCIIFRQLDLDRAILAADEELAALLEGVANRHLEKRMAGRMAVRVRDALIGNLPDGPTAKSDIAHQLCVSERTLLRRLKSEGTNFVDVLNGVRQELAFQYFKRPKMTVSEVAYLLGFSDENTFSRAFKRWTGRRPGAVLAQYAPSEARADETSD